jgi:hypothetical protein
MLELKTLEHLSILPASEVILRLFKLCSWLELIQMQRISMETLLLISVLSMAIKIALDFYSRDIQHFLLKTAKENLQLMWQ